jgi:inorganic pyrophosphatase
MTHPWHDVTPGLKLPYEFMALIEIPRGSSIKYELDKTTGLLRVDRMLYSAVHYPANYGFVPRTYAEDDDPIDVLVLGQDPVVPLAIVDARAIGGFRMRDEHGEDVKIIAVHVNDPAVSDYHEAAQLPRHVLTEIMRFFEDYKVLEHKQVIVEDMLGPEEALTIIREALDLYRRLRRGELTK